ncbi:hypothetical protein [Caproicibacter sp.]|uniref:hypothetical protein n=1 Tax=Caproicibacter sp. TaxID=2814884 RepID=UPI003988D840
MKTKRMVSFLLLISMVSAFLVFPANAAEKRKALAPQLAVNSEIHVNSTIPVTGQTNDSIQRIIANSFVSRSSFYGVTKYVKTKNGFDLYLSNSDAKKVVDYGGLGSPILGLIPDKYASIVVALLVATVLYEISQENYGHGVVIHFTCFNSMWQISYVEQQAIPMLR